MLWQFPVATKEEVAVAGPPCFCGDPEVPFGTGQRAAGGSGRVLLERNRREVDPSEAGFETAENTHFTHQAAA